MSKIGNKDLARFLVDKYDIDRAAAEQLVAQLFDVLNDGLQNEKQVKVKGLGTFKVTSVASRKSVDVNTGEPIIIEGRDKINFTADNSMRDQVNRPFAQFETVVVNDGVDFDEIDQKFADSMVESDENQDSDSDLEQENEGEPMVEEAVEESAKPAQEETEQVAEPVEMAPQPTETPQPEQLVLSSELLARLNNDGQRTAPQMEEKPETPVEKELLDETIAESLKAENTIEPVESISQAELAEPRLALSADQLALLNGTRPMGPEPEVEQESVAETEELQPETGPAPEPQPVEAVPLLQVVDTEEEEKEMHEPESQTELYDDSELEEIRNHTLELADQVEHQHRLMKIVIGVASLLLAACIGGVIYMATQLEKRNNRIQHLEAEAQQVETPVAPAVKAQPQVDTVAIAKAKADSAAAAAEQLKHEQEQEAKAKALAAAQAAERVRIQAEAEKAAEVQRQTDAKRQAELKLAAEKKQAEAKQAAQQAAYNTDARVRTGAYVITGIDRTVTVRAGQTMASISKANLGPGMECYVEAVNGGNRELKVGDKVKIPALKLKKR